MCVIKKGPLVNRKKSRISKKMGNANKNIVSMLCCCRVDKTFCDHPSLKVGYGIMDHPMKEQIKEKQSCSRAIAVLFFDFPLDNWYIEVSFRNDSYSNSIFDWCSRLVITNTRITCIT